MRADEVLVVVIVLGILIGSYISIGKKETYTSQEWWQRQQDEETKE